MLFTTALLKTGDTLRQGSRYWSVLKFIQSRNISECVCSHVLSVFYLKWVPSNPVVACIITDKSFNIWWNSFPIYGYLLVLGNIRDQETFWLKCLVKVPLELCVHGFCTASFVWTLHHITSILWTAKYYIEWGSCRLSPHTELVACLHVMVWL